MSAEPRLSIEGLQIRIGGRDVVDLDRLTLGSGEIVGLAGESGSGKSMTALAVLGLTRAMGAEVAGSIRFEGIQLVGLDEATFRRVRGRRIAMIFQSPVSSLNPVFRVGDVFVRALRLHEAGSKSDAVDRAKAALREVLLAPELLDRYPSQLSGGQAQRVSIALALALRSEVLLADEPTSALDVTVQAEILDLLRGLREETGMSVLFISHDLAVIAELCDRVAVMQRGRIVEAGPARDVLTRPSEDYTKELVASVPRVGATGR